MGSVQKTSLAAFERDLVEAEKNFAAAGAAVAKAQDSLNARRAEEGLPPLSFTSADAAAESEEEKEPEPEDARGFGFSNKSNKDKGKR
jgi:hypothetical protein